MRVIQLICFIIFLSLAGSAFAHAMLESSEPSAGARLKSPPTKIVLRFDTALETDACHITVKDAAGNPVETGPLQSDDKTSTSLRVALAALPPGHYTVEWSGISRDGHKSTGDYAFTVE